MRFKIKNQLQSVYEKYGKYASAHEAMGVLFEEIDELWLEIKQKELNFERLESEIIDCIVVLEKMYNDIVKKRNGR
jgi:hypothetical protein